DGAREVDLVTLERAIGGDVAEVLLPLLLDRERGEELGVEIPGCEPEERPAIASDDLADVGRAGLADGAGHARPPMVVGRDGERPGAEDLVVVLEVAGRAAGRPEGIAALVENAADRHVAAAGRAHEL